MNNSLESQWKAMYKDLMDTERSIRELNDRIKQGKWFYRGLLVQVLKNKMESLNSVQLDLTGKYLMLTNPEFKRLADENYTCFNDQVTFKVYSESASAMGNYTAKMEGSVHRNGCLYLETTEADSKFQIFEKYAYPKVMSGEIDYLGEVSLHTSEVDYEYEMIQSYATEYIAKINQRQQIVLVSVDNFQKLDGYKIIGKMVGQVIDEDEKIELFFSNKEKLMAIRDQFLSELKHTPL